MTRSNDDTAPLQPSPEGEGRPLYESMGGLLMRVLTGKFRISPEAAQQVLYETFVHYYGSETPRCDPSLWLIAATCRNAEEYLKRHRLPVPEGTERIEESLLLHMAIGALPSRAREAVRLHFLEDKSYDEIARELGISAHAAQRMVTRAVVKLKGMRRP